MATQDYDAWTELALVSIAAQSGTDVKFQSLTETIDIDTGEKDIDAIATLSGARLVKFTPEGITTITLEAYPMEAGTGDISSATTGTGFFDLLHQEDASQPYTITTNTQRSKYRMAIAWTNDTTQTNASSAPADASSVMRFVAADGFFTAVKPSFTDGLLKFTITFKVPPFDASGNSNIMMESTDGTASLTALQSYTSTVKW